MFVVSSYQLRVFGDSLPAGEFGPDERAEALAQADLLMSVSSARSVEVSALGHQDSCAQKAGCGCKRQLVWLVTRADYDSRRLSGAFPLFPQGLPRRGRPSGLTETTERLAA